MNNYADARFSTDDRSLSGDGIPNFNARRTDFVTEVKDIKTEVKNMVHIFQAIQEEMALQTRQRKDVIDTVSGFIVGLFLGRVLFVGGLWIYLSYA